jgi:hypothetical protein
MPHKGFFTQGVAMLLTKAPKIEAVERVLAKYGIAKRISGSDDWAFSGPSLVIPYRPEVHGYAVVDLVPHPWPDGMGNPTTEVTLFGAWASGHFGPGAYPGNLLRASQQAWSWKEAAQVAARHTAFLRVKTSYIFGGQSDAPIMPKSYEPLPELEFVTKICLTLFQLREALCYFNPNGELLLPKATLEKRLKQSQSAGPPPLDLWANVRMFKLHPSPAWSLMDTVGMIQLDVVDHEACFRTQKYDPEKVAVFLRNISLYTLGENPVFENGNTADGPGGIRWQCHAYENGLVDPPRSVLRWLPMDGEERPPMLTAPDTAGSSSK